MKSVNPHYTYHSVWHLVSAQLLLVVAIVDWRRAWQPTPVFLSLAWRMSNKHYQAFSQKQKHLQLITYEEMLGLSSNQEIGNQGHEISFYICSMEK